MKKLLALGLLLMAGLSAKAQTKADIDSLLLVKEYVTGIKTTVNSKLTPKEKVAAMDSLINLGSAYQRVLKKHLPAFASKKETQSLYTGYDFIMGSLILYKTDMKNAGYKEPDGVTDDIAFINRHVPVFINELEHCISNAKK